MIRVFNLVILIFILFLTHAEMKLVFDSKYSYSFFSTFPIWSVLVGFHARIT